MGSRKMISRLLKDNEGNPQAVVDDLESIYRRSPTTSEEARLPLTWRLSNMPLDLQQAWLNANEREKRIIVNEFLQAKKR